MIWASIRAGPRASDFRVRSAMARAVIAANIAKLPHGSAARTARKSELCAAVGCEDTRPPLAADSLLAGEGPSMTAIQLPLIRRLGRWGSAPRDDRGFAL
jgi:hypothetical protein